MGNPKKKGDRPPPKRGPRKRQGIIHQVGTSTSSGWKEKKKVLEKRNDRGQATELRGAPPLERSLAKIQGKRKLGCAGQREWKKWVVGRGNVSVRKVRRPFNLGGGWRMTQCERKKKELDFTFHTRSGGEKKGNSKGAEGTNALRCRGEKKDSNHQFSRKQKNQTGGITGSWEPRRPGREKNLG